MPGVEEDPEERIAEPLHDRVVQRAAGRPDAQALVPRGDRLEVRRHEALDVIPDRGRELGRVLDHEAGTRVERTPHAERDGERIAALDRAIARAEQPEARPRPGGQHRVARQRHPVPVEQAHGLALGHPRPQPGQHAPEAVGRLAGGVLERGQLLDLVRGAQATPRVDQQVRRVLDQAARAGQPAQLVDEEGRCLHRASVRVRLPADDPDPSPGTDALAAEDLGQRPGSIAWLPGQAEVLEQDAAHRQRRGAGRPEALVADEDRGLLGRADDRDRLLEPWVEAGQPGEVGAVLSIGVDDQPVVAATVHRLAKAVQARGVDLGRDQRLGVGHPEVGQRDVGQPGAAWSRRSCRRRGSRPRRSAR